MVNIRILLKNAVKDFAEQYRIHYRKKDWRDFAQKHINGSILSEEQKRKAIEYYKPFTKITTIFHEFYTQNNGKFCADYIPDDIYYCYIDPYYNDWQEAKYIDNKCLYSSLFPEIKQPDIVAVRMNNLWFSVDGGVKKLLPYQEIRNIVKLEEELFIKQATESDGGQGVFYYNREKKFKDIIRNMPGDIVIQRPVRQHKLLENINKSSVNTIRVISLLSSTGVKVYSCILRMGVKGSKVDNASSGGITCGITREGKLKGVAFSKGGERFVKHPDSGTVFLNYEIPGFDKIIECIPGLHYKIPHFRLVSWDFAVDERMRPVLIEANLHYGELDFHQLNNGPIFGKDTYKILKEVFNTSKRAR